MEMASSSSSRPIRLHLTVALPQHQRVKRNITCNYIINGSTHISGIVAGPQQPTTNAQSSDGPLSVDLEVFLVCKNGRRQVIDGYGYCQTCQGCVWSDLKILKVGKSKSWKQGKIKFGILCPSNHWSNASYGVKFLLKRSDGSLIADYTPKNTIYIGRNAREIDGENQSWEPQSGSIDPQFRTLHEAHSSVFGGFGQAQLEYPQPLPLSTPYDSLQARDAQPSTSKSQSAVTTNQNPPVPITSESPTPLHISPIGPHLVPEQNTGNQPFDFDYDWNSATQRQFITPQISAHTLGSPSHHIHIPPSPSTDTERYESEIIAPQIVYSIRPETISTIHDSSHNGSSDTPVVGGNSQLSAPAVGSNGMGLYSRNYHHVINEVHHTESSTLVAVSSLTAIRPFPVRVVPNHCRLGSKVLVNIEARGLNLGCHYNVRFGNAQARAIHAGRNLLICQAPEGIIPGFVYITITPEASEISLRGAYGIAFEYTIDDAEESVSRSRGEGLFQFQMDNFGGFPHNSSVIGSYTGSAVPGESSFHNNGMHGTNWGSQRSLSVPPDSMANARRQKSRGRRARSLPPNIPRVFKPLSHHGDKYDQSTKMDLDIGLEIGSSRTKESSGMGILHQDVSMNEQSPSSYEVPIPEVNDHNPRIEDGTGHGKSRSPHEGNIRDFLISRSELNTHQRVRDLVRSYLMKHPLARSISFDDLGISPPDTTHDNDAIQYLFRARKGEGRSLLYQCYLCENVLKRIDRVMDHLRKHFHLRPFLCGDQCGQPGCLSNFNSQEELQAHLKRKHLPRMACPLCNNLFTVSSLRRHRQRCIARKTREASEDDPTSLGDGTNEAISVNKTDNVLRMLEIETTK